MTDFTRKYEKQVSKWEARVNGNINNSYITEQIYDQNNHSFKPEINKKSKQIAQDIEKIEKRMGMLQEDKKKKIENLLVSL